MTKSIRFLILVDVAVDNKGVTLHMWGRYTQ